METATFYFRGYVPCKKSWNAPRVFWIAFIILTVIMMGMCFFYRRVWPMALVMVSQLISQLFIQQVSLTLIPDENAFYINYPLNIRKGKKRPISYWLKAESESNSRYTVRMRSQKGVTFFQMENRDEVIDYINRAIAYIQAQETASHD